MQIRKENVKMTLKLVETNFQDPQYGGSVYSKFLATPEEIERLIALDGLELYFGEYFGKHSEAYGLVKKDELKITELSSDEANVLQKHAGKFLEGPNIFYFYEPNEEFYHVYNAFLGDELLSRLSDEQLAYMKRRLEADDSAQKIISKETGEYYAFCYQVLTESILTTRFIREWNEKIEEDEDRVDEWRDEFYELAFTKINQEMEKE